MPNKKIKEQKNLPVYEIVIDPEDTTTGVKMVSLLSDPAIEVKGQYFKKRDWSKWSGIITPPCHQDSNGVDNCQCDIVYNPLVGDHEWVTGEKPCDFCLTNKARWDDLNSKYNKHYQFQADTEKQIVVGPFLIPNKKIFRRDPDGKEYYVVFTPEVINQIVQKFNRANNNKSINVDHTNQLAPAYILENWLVADSVYDKSKVYGYDLPVNTWFGVVKIDDKQFFDTQVKELGKFSFSVEGLMGEKLMEFGLTKEKGAENTPIANEKAVEILSDLELLRIANYLLDITHK